jgi:peptidoglycan/LPS O-acetylase OafA/YrhL
MKGGTYFENLDGLRFFCFLSVFFYHSFDTKFDYIRDSDVHHFIRHGIFDHANLGVNFFFVLSGFLITYLLIHEKKINGVIDIPRFWLRRILRIWPLFYFSVFFGFVVFPILKYFFGQTSTETASIWHYLTFFNNFDVIEKGIPDASILGALWSVAVEEQFYLIWPLVLFFLPVNRYWIVFTFIIIASWLYRMFNNDPVLYHYHTLSCIGDMAIGGFGAWLISECREFKSAVMQLGPGRIFLIYASFASIYFFRDDIFYWSHFTRVFDRSVIACVMLLIILEQCYSRHSFFKLCRYKVVSTLGVMSYGLYCFHFIGILIAKTLTNLLGFNTELWQVVFLDTALALVITILLSRASYLYFEMPFLRLKERFSFLSKMPMVRIGSSAMERPLRP